jgi:hypothetical protein
MHKDDILSTVLLTKPTCVLLSKPFNRLLDLGSSFAIAQLIANPQGENLRRLMHKLSW